MEITRPSEEFIFDAMISYCYDVDLEGRENRQRVHFIVDALLKRHLRLWIDRDYNYGGRMDQKFIQAIDSSQFVLVFITKAYIDKLASEKDNYCRLEFTYSIQKRSTKFMIPIMMEKWCIKNISSLGIVSARFGTAKYIDFSNDDNFDKRIESIIDEMYFIAHPPQLTKQKSIFQVSYMNELESIAAGAAPAREDSVSTVTKPDLSYEFEGKSFRISPTSTVLSSSSSSCLDKMEYTDTLRGSPPTARARSILTDKLLHPEKLQETQQPAIVPTVIFPSEIELSRAVGREDTRKVSHDSISGKEIDAFGKSTDIVTVEQWVEKNYLPEIIKTKLQKMGIWSLTTLDDYSKNHPEKLDHIYRSLSEESDRARLKHLIKHINSKNENIKIQSVYNCLLYFV